MIDFDFTDSTLTKQAATNKMREIVLSELIFFELFFFDLCSRFFVVFCVLYSLPPSLIFFSFFLPLSLCTHDRPFSGERSVEIIFNLITNS